MTRHPLSVLVPTLLGLAAAGFAAEEQPAPAPTQPPPSETPAATTPTDTAAPAAATADAAAPAPVTSATTAPAATTPVGGEQGQQPSPAPAQPAPTPAPVQPAPAAATPTATAPTTGEQDQHGEKGEQITATGERETAGFKPEVAHATKLEMPIEETPQAITVIPRALMESQGTFSLRDAVRNAPGLTISAGEGGTTGDAFSIRGFSANNDIYLDGMKDNGQYFRDTFNIEQVEVLKGSSALLFGRGSVGGAINQTTRKPTSRWTANAGVTAGTDSLFRGSVGAGGPVVTDVVGVRVDAIVHDADSFRDEIHVNRQGIAPTVVFALDDRTTLTLQAMYQREQSDLDYGVPGWRGHPVDVDPSTFYGFKDDDFQEFNVDQYTLAYDHRFNDHVKLRNATRFATYERFYRTNIWSNAANTAAAPTATTTGLIYHNDPSLDTMSINQSLRKNKQHNLFNQTDVTATGALGEHDVTVLAGNELGHEHYDYRNRPSIATGGQRRVSIFDPQPADSWGAGRANDLSAFSAHTENDGTTIALYSMATFEIIKGLTAVGGIRWDQYSLYSVQNRGVTLATTGLPGAPPAVTDLSRRDQMWSPRAGLVYEVVKDASVYASYGTSFSPSAEGISSTLSAATAVVSPEKTRTFEVGTKIDLLEDRILISAAVFRVEKFNARVTDPAGNLSLDGNQRTDGAELGVAGTVTDNWKVFAGGALMNARYRTWNGVTTYTDYNNPTVTPGGLILYPTVANVRQEGKRVTDAPQVTSTLWTTYDIGGSGFTIGGGLVHVGQRYSNAANTESLPRYVRFDATMGYGFKAAAVLWNAQLNVFNLFDTEYFDSSRSAQFYAPGAPRSGQLTLSTVF